MAEERVVIATGAAGGLGSRGVAQLSARGVRVLAVDLNEDGLNEVASRQNGGGEIVAHAADVTDEDDVKGFIQAALDRFGRLDAIWNNAAIQGPVKPFLEYSEDDLWRIMQVNFFSAWLGMKHALPHLIENGGGVIVNTGSSLAFRGWKHVPAYTSSKHALAGLTRSIAIEYGYANVRCSLLCPSSMDAPMLYDVAKDVGEGDADKGFEIINGLSPNGHIAPPEDVAAVGVWMLLDAPPHLSGVTLPVDGAENAG